MSAFIKNIFIGLLSFRGSLATTRLSLNNEQIKIRTFVIDWNPVELKYYRLMIIK